MLKRAFSTHDPSLLSTTARWSPTEVAVMANTESTHERRRRRSRTRCSESEFTETTDRWDRAEKGRRSKRSHSDHHHRDRDDRRRRKERNGDDHRRRRHERDDYEKNGRDTVAERTSERRPRERRHEYRNGETSRAERPEKETSFDTVPTDTTYPLAGGISIPQHIVIPPSMGERGPDGNPLPQKFQINFRNHHQLRWTEPSTSVRY
ncbi:hypothetical protein COOONC_07669 [Cooperia oncophora]